VIRILTVGTLVRDPEVKSAVTGKSYTKATVRTEAKQFKEGDPDSLMVFITAFGESANELARLTKGDSVAFAGRADIRAGEYQGRPQATINVTVDKLIDDKRPPRKPKTETPAPLTRAALATVAPDGGSIADMPEDRPW